MDVNKETNDVKDNKDLDNNKVVIENAADLYKIHIIFINLQRRSNKNKRRIKKKM